MYMCTHTHLIIKKTTLWDECLDHGWLLQGKVAKAAYGKTTQNTALHLKHADDKVLFLPPQFHTSKPPYSLHANYSFYIDLPSPLINFEHSSHAHLRY